MHCKYTIYAYCICVPFFRLKTKKQKRNNKTKNKNQLLIVKSWFFCTPDRLKQINAASNTRTPLCRDAGTKKRQGGQKYQKGTL